MKRVMIFALILPIVISIGFFDLPPASAHTHSEMTAWMDEWYKQIREEGYLSVPLVSKYVDMRVRHPWYWGDIQPSPTASPSSSHRGMGSDIEQWRGLISAYFPADQVEMALCIIRYESGGNPGAKNPLSSARGLFQILASLWAPHYGVAYETLYDPTTNTEIAADIWRNDGWSAWSTLSDCR